MADSTLTDETNQCNISTVSFDRKCISPIMDQEIAKASPNTTMKTITLRAIDRIFVACNITVADYIFTKSRNTINIAPDIRQLINQQWQYYLLPGNHMNSEEMNIHDKYKNNDYLMKPEAKKLINIMVKRNIESRQLNEDKEQIIKSIDLPEILAADGLKGTNPNEMKAYVENLNIGKESNNSDIYKHVNAIRKMYSLFPSSITGTDAMHIIKITLLITYLDHIKNTNQEMNLQQHIEDTRSYLETQSRYYEEIKGCLEPEFTEELKKTYLEHVNDSIELIVMSKVVQLKRYARKRLAKKDMNLKTKVLKTENDL